MEPDLEEAGSPTRAQTTVASRKPSGVLVCIIITVLIAISVVFGCLMPNDTLHPTFSVDVAGLDDGPKPAATINPAFNLTLHGVSRRCLIGSVGLCQERGTVAVSYAGAVLAWGRVPEQGQAHVRMVALGAGVELSDELRERMASEWLDRAAQLDVDITLDQWRFLSCRVKLDEASPEPSPCKGVGSKIFVVKSIVQLVD
jgi:hypothetical protein